MAHVKKACKSQRWIQWIFPFYLEVFRFLGNLVYFNMLSKFWKGALSGLRQFLTTRNGKKCFLFRLKNSFCSWDISIFVLSFWSCRKKARKENFQKVNFQIYDVTNWLESLALREKCPKKTQKNSVFGHISHSVEYTYCQTSQEYNMKIFFLEKSLQK